MVPNPGALPGRENAILTEPTSSHAECLKTRRLPPPHLHELPSNSRALPVWSRCPSEGQVHLRRMAGDHFPRENVLTCRRRCGEKKRWFKKKGSFSRFLGDVLRTLCWASIFIADPGGESQPILARRNALHSPGNRRIGARAIRFSIDIC